MIATGIVIIEPALARLVDNSFHAFKIFQNSPDAGSLVSISIIFSILIILIVVERNQKGGRWVFPLILGLYFIAYIIMIFRVPIGPWESFAKWFISLPLS
jgi:Ca2+/Na+ antiporter